MAINDLIELARKHPRFMLDRLWIRSVALPAEDLYSTYFFKPVNGNVNQREIRVHGLRRTGNHAIINWIEKQASGFTVHLNNLRPEENPFKNYWRILEDKVHPREKWRVAELSFNDLYQGSSGYELVKQEAKGKFIEKDCLILSYEDCYIPRVSSARAVRTHDRYVGKSKEIFDLIILRDPYNLIASRMRSNMLGIKGIGKTLPELWIDYAKEYLGETQHLKYVKVPANYNQWFLDKEYRRTLANKLNLNFSDVGINDVPIFGQGSSFDSTGLDGQAQKMNVLNRWERYVDNENYRKLLDNEELIYYSERIFGHIPGTEKLRK